MVTSMTGNSDKSRLAGLTRRTLFSRLTGAAGLAATAACQTTAINPVNQATEDAIFGWGVASGDPTRTSVIIWTRAVPQNAALTVLDVAYDIASDSEFRSILTSGIAQTSASRDFTVKIDVGGLAPGETYYYRFRAGGTYSPTGRTRTLPADDSRPVNLALASCANYPSGFYNAYREISRIEDLDAVVHVGDYIYEHAAGAYDGKTGEQIGRVHLPANEIVTLADYRERLAQYREDADLQAAHAHAPFITVWDDHETANNSWQGGASGHDPETEGKWESRRNAALQAYFEWLPMRDPTPGEARERLNRVYDFGSIASLIVIETRLTGRDQQLSFEHDMPKLADGSPDLEKFDRDVLGNPDRSMMGHAQEAWFADTLKQSRQRDMQWQVIANQTVMARMRSPDFMTILPPEIVEPAIAGGGYVSGWLQRSALGLPVGLDAWDGYSAARTRFYDSALEADANLVVLSGDSHMFWANDLHYPGPETFVGVELATGSITSPGGYGYINNTPEFYDTVERAVVARNPDVQHANVRDHGFVHLMLTRDEMRARYISVSTITDRTYEAKCFLDVRSAPGSGLSEVKA
jgi:alkaline phosphatase/alkaline phosphatase D